MNLIKTFVLKQEIHLYNNIFYKVCSKCIQPAFLQYTQKKHERWSPMSSCEEYLHALDFNFLENQTPFNGMFIQKSKGNIRRVIYYRNVWLRNFQLYERNVLSWCSCPQMWHHKGNITARLYSLVMLWSCGACSWRITQWKSIKMGVLNLQLITSNHGDN